LLDLGAFDLDLAQRETRVAYPDPPSGLPAGPLLFRELYCDEPRCDCRRVLILVSDGKGTILAGLNYQFEPPRPGDPEPSQLEIDPLNPQSRYSARLRDLFEWMVSDRAYHDRLVRHYTLFKAAVDDPGHPRHAAVRSPAHDAPDHRPAFPKKPAAKKPATKPPKATRAARSATAPAAANASSLYVFSLGPIETEGGDGTLYLGLLNGAVLPPPNVSTAAAALRHFRALAPPGARLECEPSLSKSAPKAGFAAVPPTEAARAMRAELALVLAHPGIAPRAGQELGVLIQAARAFWDARPWERLPMSLPLSVTLTGAVPGTYECAVMGSGGDEFGVALYPRAGSMAAVARAMAEGRPDRAMAFDSFSLTLDDEPEFAANAIFEWCGLTRVPIVFALRAGVPGPVDKQEALALAVTLQALSQVSGAPAEVVTLSLQFGDTVITVTVRTPTLAPLKKPTARKKR